MKLFKRSARYLLMFPMYRLWTIYRWSKIFEDPSVRVRIAGEDFQDWNFQRENVACERGTWILIFVPNPRSNAALRVQYANFENRPIGAGRSKKCKKFLGYLSISLLNYTILGYVKCFKHLSIKIKIPFKEISCRVPERISTRRSGISNKFLRPEAKHRRSYPAPAQNQKCSKNRPVEAGCWKEMSSDT